MTVTSDGHARAHGNGPANPVSVPLVIRHNPGGRATSDFHLDALYEGPPGITAGVVALTMDQVFGEAAAASGTPG